MDNSELTDLALRAAEQEALDLQEYFTLFNTLGLFQLVGKLEDRLLERLAFAIDMELKARGGFPDGND